MEAARDAVEVKVSGDEALEDTEVDEDGLLFSGVFLFSEEAKGWLTLGRLLLMLESTMPGEAWSLGSLA